VKIQIFKNLKGLIYGADPKRISCNTDGVLKIGTTEISVSAERESIMPLLFGGCTGSYKATFEDKLGNIYELEKVTVNGGWIAPPPQSAVEFMELRCRAEALEERCESLEEKVRELSNIFDTNSLNFLIN
jgi:hypothetical protein